MSSRAESPLRPADLAGFTGTQTWYRHALIPSITYTEGAKFLADKAGAHWLLDKVATTQLAFRDRARRRENFDFSFQVWRLEDAGVGEGGGARLVCDDGNGNVLHRERIDWTDFPFDTAGDVRLYFFDDVIMLPSEY